MVRYCPSCGTEVEDSAVFCPTCGQPIDQAAETEMPAAPTWPERAPDEPPAGGSVESAVDDGWHTRFEEPTRVKEAPPGVEERDRPRLRPDPVAPLPAAAGREDPAISLPVTMPVTLSAWLIGGGTTIAALGVLIGLFDGFLNPIDLVLLIVLVGIAATVFFSANVPAIPHLRLATFVVVLIAFGIALNRIGFGGAGIGDLLLFLGAAAATIGALLLELGRDQPLGGPQH